jgi:hypothetical protein
MDSGFPIGNATGIEVGFHRIFDEKLPVAPGLDVLAPGDDHVAHAVRVEQVGEIADIVFQRRGVVAVIDENEPGPDLDPDRQQPVFGLVEAVGLLHRGRRQHRAVEPGQRIWRAVPQPSSSSARRWRQKLAKARSVPASSFAIRTGPFCLDRSVPARIAPLIDGRR